MASPRPNAASATGLSAPSTQPLTPPADAPASSNPASHSNVTNSSNLAPVPTVINPAQVPATSLQDSGKTRRPRDARLIHMLLASLGVTSYQERVPLQLLDFAYRYTSSALQDAVYLATEGYPGDPPHQKGHPGADGSGGRAQHPSQDLNSVSLGALRMSIASRLHYQFQPGLPKEFLMDIAAERNRIMLPGVSRGHDGGATSNVAGTGAMMGGMRLPPERFCLTGVGWGLKEEWESEGEEEMEIDNAPEGGPLGGRPEETDDVEGEGDGRMEDVFGDGTLDGGGRDRTMTDV